DAGLENPSHEARLLVAACLAEGRTGLALEPAQELTREEEEFFKAALERRRRREPLSRILGKREFWSLPFKISPAVLDPRADSETLVEGLLESITDRSEALRVLDLGTGSGCLLLALLSELPSACGLGLDISHEAIAVAKENARALQLDRRASFKVADWQDGIGEGWDVILSNPPYVSSRDIARLSPEVRDYDPHDALDGGEDGLDAYRQIVALAAGALTSCGLLALELGIGQAAEVRNLLASTGFASGQAKRDLGGIDRVIVSTFAKK
ncbi:MAG: peptide chain release factor N(5)-glutamine methyltransferase, partial [Kiloniellales bacterium]|nr:peptide chain release factor N(5)-glutamine methyltransferase [Kiloniellales bacterium]